MNILKVYEIKWGFGTYIPRHARRQEEEAKVEEEEEEEERRGIETERNRKEERKEEGRKTKKETRFIILRAENKILKTGGRICVNFIRSITWI